MSRSRRLHHPDRVRPSVTNRNDYAVRRGGHGAAPPSQSGQTTLMLLAGTDAALANRPRASKDNDMMPTPADADVLAERAHHGQVDKADRPYIQHPRTVARILADQGHGDHALMAGLLHDIVEDTDVTLDDLRQRGYPGEVVRAVDAVTRREGESYMDLICRAAADPLGRLVKLADNETNSDPARLALLDDEQRAWFTEKYAKARAVLEAAAQ